MIKKFLKYSKEDSLIRDSITFFSASMILNITAYLFHLYMGRVLGPSSYGILGALLSITYILNVPLTVIQTSVTKFAAQYKAKKEINKINTLLISSIKRLSIFGIIGTIIFFILSPLIGYFLHIKIEYLFILSPIIIFSLLLPLTRGILQGLQRFNSLSLNMILEGLIKLSLGILLVYMGLNIGGAILAIIFSFVIAFFLTFIPLKQFLVIKNMNINTKEIYNYTIPVLIALTSLTFIYTIDIFIVKHFFNEIEAGYYAALSLIGKIIFFGTFAIANVMFPKVAEMHASNKPNKKIMNKSLLLTLTGASIAVIIYFIFPKLIITLLFGKDYLGIYKLVGPFGLVMALFSLVYLLSLYNLSIHKTRFIYILILFNILEVILLFLFHNTLTQVVTILVTLMIALFIILYLYTSLITKNEKTIYSNTSI